MFDVNRRLYTMRKNYSLLCYCYCTFVIYIINIIDNHNRIAKRFQFYLTFFFSKSACADRWCLAKMLQNANLIRLKTFRNGNNSIISSHVRFCGNVANKWVIDLKIKNQLLLQYIIRFIRNVRFGMWLIVCWWSF